jgi:aromatic-L-amino-acid decarboxylase
MNEPKVSLAQDIRERTLDPADWEAFRAEAHGALDKMVDHLRDLRQRPVWRPASAEAKAFFRRPLPAQGQDLARTLEEFERYIKPYVMSNPHPMFMGWVQGAGTPVGMVAEMLAAGLDSNCGGRNQIVVDVERQIAAWMAQAFGFPPDASGIFVTGASMANFLGLLVARERATEGENVRLNGLNAVGATLVAYASREVHNCVRQAMELSGLGARHLRLIPSDERRVMRVNDLAHAIAADRAAGLKPFMIVGTAGTVDTGAIDDLDALADVAREEDLWFHIDGAFGALAALSPKLKPLVKGMERADSIAFDFHKWLHVPYDAGFVLVRDPQAHLKAFKADAAYLSRAPRGLAAGDTWPCDLGPDLSRGFRALKTWFTIETFGTELLGACIERTCRMAQRLERLIEASPTFFMRAPVALNVVCFGVTDDADGALAREIVMDLHESGEAAPSLTILDGTPAIRAAIINHRTTESDIDKFMALLQAAQERARRAIGAVDGKARGAEAEKLKQAPSGPGRTPLSQD